MSITERQSGNVFIRDVRLEKVGDSIPGHTHNYDHTMFFMKGEAKLTVITNESVEESVIKAPADMLIVKNARHAIEALTDDVYFCCVFPHRNREGEVTDEPSTRTAYL
jgi:quercetin dioxygenase-like cupin family protein